MGELVPVRFSGAVYSPGKTAVALRSAARMVNVDDGLPILKLDKHSGDWSYGAEGEPLDPNDLVAINPHGFKHGYIAFNDNEVAFREDGQPAEILHSVNQELMDFDDLPQLEEPRNRRKNQARPEWKFQLAFVGVIINGPAKNTELTYKPTSLGGLRFMRVLSEEIARRIEDDDPKIVPIIELFSRSYEHKKWGTTWVPEFAIVDWRTLGDAAPVTRSEERTNKGHKVDERKPASTRSREADDAEIIDDKPAKRGRPKTETRGLEDDDAAEERGSRKRTTKRTGKRDDEPRDDDREEPRGKRRDRDEEDARENDEPRGKRRPRDEEDESRGKRRDRDEEDAPEDDEPRGKHRAADRDDRAAEPSKRSKRDEEAEEEDARPRGKGRDEEPRSGPRGRNAAAGSRR